MASLAAPASRLTSIDALRGLTVAFMILVNDPGDWNHIYWPLDHAEWNGFTPTDMVFPMFLFLVGCSIVFSVESRLRRGDSRPQIALQMLRRAATIFLIDLFLTAYPQFHLHDLRLFGVLTRIALCYLVAGLLFLYTRSAKALALIAAAILIGYWMLLRFVPVPDFGLPVRDIPMMDPERNLVAWLDRGVTAWTQRWLHTGRLFEGTRDPEGLLSSLPAVATTLIGILAALWLRARHTAARTRNALLAAGACAVALGALWNHWFPINKNIWTSSFVLFAGGWSLLALALAYWLLDVRRLQESSRTARAALWPMLVFGANAITAYVISEFTVDTLLAINVPHATDPRVPGHTLTAWAWIYLRIFARYASTQNTSLAFAMAFTLACFIPNWILWRKKIFLRV